MSRREQGVAEWTSISGRTTTLATITCCHCNGVTIITQGAKAEDCGGFCLRCMQPTCKTCADKGCTPCFGEPATGAAFRTEFSAAAVTGAGPRRPSGQ